MVRFWGSRFEGSQPNATSQGARRVEGGGLLRMSGVRALVAGSYAETRHPHGPCFG